MQSMKMTDDVFRSFKVAKVFRENTDKINCLDFSHTGENMIASSNDDSIVVYCCLEGRFAVPPKTDNLAADVAGCALIGISFIFCFL